MMSMSKQKLGILLVGVVSIIVIVVLCVTLIPKNDESKDSNSSKNTEDTAYFTNGAVATDAEDCSKIGRDVLKEGGHAVDAAIAALICTGVVNLHSTGIGGGGFMTLYDKKTKTSKIYDYREVGPASLTATTYDNPNISMKVDGFAVGVPGELRGLKRVHDDYGKLEWSRLIQPSIQHAEKGTRINKHMYANMKSSSTNAAIMKDPGLKEILFFPNGTMKGVGDVIFNKKYADTLRKVAGDFDVINNGSLSKSFLEDVNSHGGNMTEEDLRNYKVSIREPIKNSLGSGLTLHTTPLPGGGSVLVHMLNIIQGLKFTNDSEEDLVSKILTYHQLTETFKFSYAMRPHLGDPDTIPDANKADLLKSAAEILNKTVADEHRLKINDSFTQDNGYYDPFFVKKDGSGTTHVSVIDKDGNAVSATDTINYAFGAKFRSNKTGIIYNNELADFFTKDSYSGKYGTPVANAPGSGRRPLSSTCPSIITNEDGDVVMVVGGSGGTRITLSTAWVIMKKLWFGYDLSKAVEDPRVQHTFFPEYIRNENGAPLSKEIIEGLEKKGHVVTNSRYNAIVQGIYVEGEKIYAKSDPRKGGVAAGY